MKNISLTLLLIIIPSMSYSKDLFLDVYIKENRLNAAIVIEEMKSGKKYIYNRRRADIQYLPASTFKVVNTLIALQERIIKDEKEIIKWDGTDKGVPSWNRDQSLETAFPASCVWFYQELAKQITDTKYLAYLKSIKYGNMKTGKDVDSFWLDGDMKISAAGQIAVLKNIYNEKYPFDKKNYAVLKRLMTVERTEEYIIYAKTGWAARIKPQIGWYIGFIETKDNVWFFSCNMEINTPEDTKYRQKIIDRALRELKIIK